MMKPLVKSLLLVCLAAAILWGMARWELIDWGLIASAFQHNSFLVACALALQFLYFIVLMFRYVSIVRAFQIRPPFRDMMTATFVSVAIGQWAPGALAVMEMLRLGLMFGTQGDAAALRNARPRLVVASLYDRLIGFAVMLFFGFSVSVGVLVSLPQEAPGTGLVMLTLFSASGSASMLALPFLARLPQIRRLLGDLKHAAESRDGPLFRVAGRLSGQAESLRHELATGGAELSRFLLPAGMSALGFFLNAAATWCTSAALGTPIPFAAVCAVIPIIALAGLLPLGLGGVGGYQLVSAAVFQVFAIDARVASGSNLLQNALALSASTLLGLLFARSSVAQIRKIIEGKPSSNKITPGISSRETEYR